MNTYLEKRWGGGGKNPTELELRDALAELKRPDPEHPDCWLSDENNLTLSAYESGRVILENAETGEGPWHMSNADDELVMTLWRHLQRGEVAEIRRFPWKEGYK